jgi:transcriptional regulator
LWKACRPDSEVLVIFQGPQAYISPNWYATKQQTGEVVPTWNYAVVHARGPLTFTHDADWLLSLVSRLTNAHEARQDRPWAVSDAPAEYTQSMLGLIVGFEILISSLVGKFKLSQNRTQADRHGVLEALAEAEDDQSRAMASLLDPG